MASSRARLPMLSLAILLGATAPALAAPCAGFSDVSDGDAFCTYVDWIRNRGITQGCSPGLYCPSSDVTRLQMAAFLNRLGDALAPTFISTTAGGTQAFNDGSVMCVTEPYVVSGFPRIASGSGSIYFTASTSTNGYARLMHSVDDEAWAWFAAYTMPGANVPGGYATVTSTGRPVGLPVGSSVRFGIRNEHSGSTATDAGCELVVRIESLGPAAATDALPGPMQDLP